MWLHFEIESAEKKESLRQHLIDDFKLLGFPIFWDRDSVGYGDSIDAVIAKALDNRPIHILCMCDDDYFQASSREGSGLQRELEMISSIADSDGVRIMPIILEESCKNLLPQVLRSRMYLDLTMLHTEGLPFGEVLVSAVAGAKQPEIAEQIFQQLRANKLVKIARKYFAENPVDLYGDARTHEVRINDRQLLLPPEWMHTVTRWSARVRDDSPEFSPMKGIWHWDHWTTSTGMRAFGTAVISTMFPTKYSVEDIATIEYCGDIIAQNIISFTKKTEPLTVTDDEIFRCIVSNKRGLKALERLLQ